MNEKKKEALFKETLELNRQIFHGDMVPGSVYDAYNSRISQIEENGWFEDWIAWKAEQPEEDEEDDCN